MIEAQNKNFIIDFDSTFTQVEALDVLCEIVLDNHPSKSVVLEKIEDITNEAMGGSLSFRESLEQRLSLLKANKKHLPYLIEKLDKLVSKSFIRNKDFLERNKDNIYIISNGFKEFICPIVQSFGIKEGKRFC